MAKLSSQCRTCSKIFTYYTSKQKGYYCSTSCAMKSRWEARTIQPNFGEKNGMWKEDAGYQPVHAWARRHLGKPSKCEYCGTTQAKKFEWASKSHSYKRVLDDWIRLCTSCHRKYDMTNEYRKNLSINGMKGAVARWHA